MPNSSRAYFLVILSIVWALAVFLKLSFARLVISQPTWLPQRVGVLALDLLSAAVLLGWLIPLIVGACILWKNGLRPRFYEVVRALWVLSSIIALAVVFVRYNNALGRGGLDDQFLMAAFMGALSFPSGIFVFVVNNLCSSGGVLPPGRLGMIVFWSLFFVAGYTQWFILLPAVRRRIKKPRD